MGLSQNDISLRGRVTLWAQRNSWRVPRGVRRIAKKLLISTQLASASDGIVDDWSRPLVPHDTSVAPNPPVAPASIPTGGVWKRDDLLVPPGSVHCLIVTPVLDAGGLDEFVAFLARRLPHFGFRVTVMCAHQSAAPAGELFTTLQREGTEAVAASPNDACLWFETNRPDVISAHDPPGWLLRAASAARIPVVETLHGIPTPISTNWREERRRSKFIVRFVAVSELVRRQYLSGNPSYPDSAVITIPNAFNQTHRPAVNRSKARAWLGLNDEFLFLSLGRHTVQKNAYGLVRAFAEVAENDRKAHLLIAGRLDDAVYTRQVRTLRDTMPCKDRIHLRQSFPTPSILLAAADCFVLNSFFEGWSLASMEALSAGLPAIVSDVGGAREQIGMDGSRGFVVANPVGDPERANWHRSCLMRFRPQKNKEELVSAMKSVLARRDHWSAVREQLSADSQSIFDPVICSRRHAEVLLSAISRSATESQFADYGRP
ncbi:glycosyltransferase [Bradyrhizobium sp. WBAH42]|nr:glycosyltransferase [Bradyrhizobium sp. WBAH30]MDD1541229.1 glycosyltransferase [Bradyrhizobium sp. WBAH41]MDD1557147.1 glycosyltransferase [Bradyrhizobium sp. WBAH23]MDD1563864.1 glycosyltransferase [Bradyrhizobium sp. WBAH33]MDD1589967.1 glycosyltransferase [Bradyrhizobium sp. WBAH42]NRB86920.1 glycosyltransferase [Bradyrhizobium sp. WBAH10]QCJ90622.1 glycosyltransferase [Bradyrhizobium yuanmingense]